MKTLLVQDAGQDTTLSHCLKERGYAVTECRGVQAGKEALARDPFPLVVVDLLAAGHGEEFCRWLRTQVNRDGRFVLLGVEPGKTESWPRALSAGADDLLLKPYEVMAVQVRLAIVERQIQHRLEWQRKIDGLNLMAQQQVAIAALGHLALSQDFPTVLESVGCWITQLLDVNLWILLELSEDGQSLRPVAGFGWRADYLCSTIPRPTDQFLSGRGLRGDDSMATDFGDESETRALDFVREHGAVSGISVAVKGGKSKNTYGVLEAYATERRAFLEEDLHFLQNVANVLGALIERKQAEAEVQKYQSQMQHLQRLESVGQVAAGLAHDYNNVLTVIHGHVTLALGDAKLPAHLARSLKLVLEAAERAANLTRQMLSFSRKQSLQPQAVDLNVIITRMAKLLDRVLARNIQLKVEPMPDLPAIQADPGMLDQVVMNLTVNARDAMPKGGSLLLGTAVVTVDPARGQRHPEARPGTFVCLNVSDTGCGMDEATLRRIFDPFFTTKEPGQGTGLGLSTVYGIVKQLQGWIEVESQPGRGTTFQLFFPILRDARPEPVVLSASAKPDSGSETVLLVEDEPALREPARLLLEGLGYRVLEAGSGQEALEVWNQHQHTINVLLTDLVMPDGLSGFELAERVGRERPGVNVIFTSGYSADEVSQKFPVQRGFRFIQKPYRAESLGRALRACLDDKQDRPLSSRQPG